LPNIPAIRFVRLRPSETGTFPTKEHLSTCSRLRLAPPLAQAPNHALISKTRAMDDSDLDNSDGVIDHDLLYDLNVENYYDNGPFAPLPDLNHAGFHGFDLEYPNIDDYRGGASSDEEIGEQYGVQYDVSEPESSSEEDSDDTEENERGDEEQYLQRAPVPPRIDVGYRESASESDDEYPDEGFEEAVEGLQASHFEEYDWDLEHEVDGEDEFDEDDDLGDHIHIPYLPFPIDSDLSASESESESSQGSDEVSSPASHNSPSPDPAPPAIYNVLGDIDDFHDLDLDLDLILEDHIRLIERGERLQFARYVAAPQPALPNRLAQEEAQQYLAEVEMEDESAYRYQVRRDRENQVRRDRERNRMLERFGPEVLQPAVGRDRRRTAAQAFDDPPPRPQPRQQQPLYIDLTDEPDSPPARGGIALPNQPRFSGHPNANRHRHAGHNHQNPRRQGGIHRTPSLARSDGSLLGPGARPGGGPGPGGAPVIDLTGDGPEFEIPPRRDPVPMPLMPGGWRAAIQPPNMNDMFGMIQRHLYAAPGDILERIRFGWAGGFNPEVEVQFLGENQRQHNGPRLPGFDEVLAAVEVAENPLANNPPGNFNYAGNGFGRDAPRDKPVHIAPPDARPGFTRATGEDTDVICPSCESELLYDPDDKDEPPAKKARTRKDREEHHFWAVKNCGHASSCQFYHHDWIRLLTLSVPGLLPVMLREPRQKVIRHHIRDVREEDTLRRRWLYLGCHHQD
jgi:hypothetical protein